LKEREQSAEAAASPEPGTAADGDTPNAADAELTGSGDSQDAADDLVGEAPDEVIEALRSQLDEFEDRHLRLVAEFDNFRKRTARERAQQAERAQAELVKGLLESLDDLARVSEHGSVEHDAGALLEGVQLVEVKLLRALEQAGLKPVEAVGKPFDPEVHEALLTVPTSTFEQDHVVSQEFTKGYLFKDTLLRPSLVEVKQYQPGAADTGEGSDGATDQGDDV
jgi:molecular chaperone GrpE